MRNRVKMLRAMVNGQSTPLEMEAPGDGRIICRTPLGEISIRESEDDLEGEFLRFLEAASAKGINVIGCFNCRFYFGPLDATANPLVGWCLEGRLGKELRPGWESTSADSVCDAHSLGDDEARRTAIEGWTNSVKNLR